MTQLPPAARWKHATAGLELVGIVGLLGAVGYWLDARMGSSPWGLLTGCFIGIFGGLYRLIRQASDTFRPRK